MSTETCGGYHSLAESEQRKRIHCQGKAFPDYFQSSPTEIEYNIIFVKLLNYFNYECLNSNLFLFNN